jgi:hypothetical protein
MPLDSPPLSLETVVRASSNQVCARVGDDLVVLDLDSSLYYALDPVGARIFELLQEPTSLSAIADAVAAEFEVDAQTARADLLALAGTLLAQKLIEARTADAR